MAGIFALYLKKEIDKSKSKLLEKYALKIKHRGQKYTYKYEKFPFKVIFHQKSLHKKNKILNFSFSEDNSKFIAIDGQIYNSEELNKNYLNSDYRAKYNTLNLEGLLAGFERLDIKILNYAIGSFSGIIINDSELIGFKDPVGAKPLYYCETDDFFALSSELKALAPLKREIKPVIPGKIISSNGREERYFHYPEFVKDYKITKRKVLKLARELNKLVKLAVMDNIKKGEKISSLLSGGLDSAIITYIAKDYISDLNVYTVGVNDSKDLYYAKEFAKLYNLNHKILKVRLKDMLECLPDVIYALETFDAALIRSSVPMFLLLKEMNKNKNFDVILTGEGGDELFGGYEYLKNFDSYYSLNNELLNLLKIEHLTGLQRVDRIPYYFSIEARAPLFDRRLVEYCFKIPPELKILKKKYGTADKWILRKAFEDEIPDEFIWRKKQKFSDGAGTKYLLRNHIESNIKDEEFNSQKQITPSLTLKSKEELFYWRIFNSQFNPTKETLSEIPITKNYII
ncbi:MAG: asparagine synthase-related protein [Candidatus Hodarchaeota archaeon]